MLDLLNYITNARKKFEKDLSIQVLIQAAINTGLPHVELCLPRKCGKTRAIAAMSAESPGMLVVGNYQQNPFTRNWRGHTRPFGEVVSVIVLDDLGTYTKKEVLDFIHAEWAVFEYPNLPQIIDVNTPLI